MYVRLYSYIMCPILDLPIDGSIHVASFTMETGGKKNTCDASSINGDVVPSCCHSEKMFMESIACHMQHTLQMGANSGVMCSHSYSQMRQYGFTQYCILLLHLYLQYECMYVL